VGQGDPRALGVEFAQTFAPLISAAPSVDVWEGPNEYNPDTLANMAWYAEFLSAFACQMHLLGKRAAIGSFATGTPEIEMWRAYAPALKACRDYGAYHARHCYGPLTDWYAFRYRRDQAAFQGMGFNPSIIITECGQDAPNPPWRKLYGDDIVRYWREWLRPFTLGVNQDSYVVGATVFTVGDGHARGWHNFDVSGTGLINLMQQDLKEIQMPQPVKPALFQMQSNPLIANVMPVFSTPDQKAMGTKQVTYPIDVYAIKVTTYGVWFQVVPDGTLWVRAIDCMTM
jgi:hypothetical protein